MPRIIIGSDHAGFALKEKLKVVLTKRGFSVRDVGTNSPESCDYPLYAALVARAISEKKFSRGILICATGIGNSIVANRFPGVRASLCYSVAAAQLTRQHNDSNILVLGSKFTPARTAEDILARWLATRFEGGRHLRRVKEITQIERAIRCKRR